MLGLFQKRQRKSSASAVRFEGSPGKRCYAIGDVHGRLDLLQEMFSQIEARERKLPRVETFIVLLGDLIDRGPDSSGVIDFLIARTGQSPTLIVLAGNHEELLLSALNGDHGALQRWLSNGGDACARSYGLNPGQLEALEGAALVHTLESAIPWVHREFLRRCRDSVRFGDYFLVHAGIRPGVELDHQRLADLRWIRSDFLESNADHGVIVVHGHSNLERVDRQSNRIGIDTSAHRTGVLTAVVIEGADIQFLETANRSVTAPLETP